MKDVIKHAETQKSKSSERFTSISNDSIEDVVRRYVDFSHGDRNGWNPVYCAVCGDGSRTKGPRGGWKFDGEDAGYNCFNCGIHGSFTPEEEYPMSKDMKKILIAFGVPKKEYSKILFRLREADPNFKPREKTKKEQSIEKMISNAFPMPDFVQPLENVIDSEVGTKCLAVLEDKHVDYKDYPFFVSTGVTKSKNPTDKSNAKITVNRLIIPIFYKEHLIMLQAKDITGRSKNPYINIGSVSSTIYGLDRLNPSHKYVMVTEGFWDAYHLNGVAVITNNISSFQLGLLNELEKDKVVVPDRMGDYNTLANRGVASGWGISAPKEFKNIKDVTDCVKKYGKLYTLYILMNNVALGDKAQLITKNI